MIEARQDRDRLLKYVFFWDNRKKAYPVSNEIDKEFFLSCLEKERKP
jgi:hypothetical protein